VLRLILIRHGDILRPSTANFDEAHLSELGKQQMRDLAANWSHPKPDQVYSSTLPRAIESGWFLVEAFGGSLRVLEDFREWSPSKADITEEQYLALEEKCWKDHDLEFDTAESINEATKRVKRGIWRVVGEMRQGTAVVVSHGMILTMFIASLKGEKPDIEYKRKILNGAQAVVEYEEASFRIVKEFF